MVLDPRTSEDLSVLIVMQWRGHTLVLPLRYASESRRVLPNQKAWHDRRHRRLDPELERHWSAGPFMAIVKSPDPESSTLGGTGWYRCE